MFAFRDSSYFKELVMKLLAYAAVGFSMIAGAAQSAIITADLTPIVNTAQTYSQTITLPTNVTFADVTLGLMLKGDYDLSSEYFNFYIDGTQLLSWNASSPSIFSTTIYPHYDYLLMGSLSISDVQWTSFASDQTLNLSWSNGPNVNAYAKGGLDFVSCTLTGTPSVLAPNTATQREVPEPLSLALLGLGLAAIGYSRRKKAND